LSVVGGLLFTMEKSVKKLASNSHSDPNN